MDEEVELNVNEIRAFFVERDDFIMTIRYRKDQQFTESIFQIIKETITRYNLNDFSKEIFRSLYKV